MSGLFHCGFSQHVFFHIRSSTNLPCWQIGSAHGTETVPFQEKNRTMTLEEKHVEIWNYLKEIKVGMFTTSSDAYMSSRPMYLVQEAYEGVLWLFADKEARKITDIRINPHVNMNFMAPDDGHFVALSGIASVYDSGAQFDALWSDDVKIWFNDGADPKGRAVLIRIDVDSAEIWNSDQGMFRRVFEYAKARVTGSRPNMGENKVISQ